MIDKTVEEFINDFLQDKEPFMFFLGAGFSSSAGIPTGSDLAIEIKKRLQLKNENESTKENLYLDDFIENLLQSKKKDEICQIIQEIISIKEEKSISYEPVTKNHQLFYIIIEHIIQQLTEKNSNEKIYIATTNWDKLLRNVFGEKAVYFYSQSKLPSLKKVNESRIEIFHLHGSIEDFESMAIIKKEKMELEEKNSKIWNQFKAALDTHRALILGYSMSDPDIFNAYIKARKENGFKLKQDYIFINDIASKEKIEKNEDIQKLGENKPKIILYDSFKLLKDILVKMGNNLPTESSLDLNVHQKIKKTLEGNKENNKNIIVTGYPLSGLSTTYLKFSDKLPSRSICYEGNGYIVENFLTFNDIISNIKEGMGGAIFAPHYVFEKYCELNKINERDLKRFHVYHEIRKDEAERFLNILIENSNYKDTFSKDEHIKNVILEHCAQKENDKDTYPLGMLKAVFSNVEKRLSTGEDLEKINKDIKQRKEEWNPTLELFSVGSLLEFVSMGEHFALLPPAVDLSILAATKQILPGISSIIGGVIPQISILFIAAGLTYDLIEWIKRRNRGRLIDFKHTLSMKEYWDSLSFEEKRILCYQLDKKRNAIPGSSFNNLSSLFSVDWRHITDTINTLQRDQKDLEKKVEEFINKYNSELIKWKDELKHFSDFERDIYDALRVINEEITALRRLEEITTDQDLRNFYNVPSSIDPAKVHNNFEIESVKDGISSRENYNIGSLIEQIKNWNDTSDPWIYAIIGEAGTGKSWFTFRVISDIFNSKFSEEDNNTDKLKFYKILNGEGFSYPTNKSILLLDDGRIQNLNSIDRVLEEIVLKDSIYSPIFITTTEAEWNKIYESACYKITNEEQRQRLETKVVKIKIGKMTSEEIRESLEILLKKNQETSIRDNLIPNLIQKVDGLPILLDYFLDGRKGEIGAADINEIEHDPKSYALKKFVHFYLFDGKIIRNDDERMNNLIKILALLKALIYEKDLVVGQIDKDDLNIILGQNLKNNELYCALDTLFRIQDNTYPIGKVIINNGRIVANFPLFKIDDYGRIQPIHNSVRSSFEDLLSLLSGDKAIINNFNNLRGRINFITIKSIDSSYNKIKSELHSVPEIYEDFLNTEIVKYEKDENLRRIFNETKFAFGILSITIPKKDEKFKLLVLNNAINFNDQDDLLALQIASLLFDTTGLYNINSITNIDKVKLFILSLFSSNKENVRIKAWYNYNKIYRMGLIKLNEVTERFQYYISLLASTNEKIRSDAWSIVSDLIRNNIITSENAKLLLELLKINESEMVSADAWNRISEIIDRNVITPDKVKEKINYFFEFLRHQDEKIRFNAWLTIPSLIKKDIINSIDVSDYINYFFELLSSENKRINSDAWKEVPALIETDIIKPGNSGFFLDLLTSKNELISSKAWLELSILIDKRIIREKEGRERVQYFFKLMDSTDVRISLDSWSVISKLIIKGIIKDEEIKDKKIYLINLLNSHEEDIRYHAFHVALKLIEGDIIGSEVSEVFLNVLTQDDEKIRFLVWSNIVYLINKRIIEIEKVRKSIDYFYKFLNSYDEKIRSFAWGKISSLIKRNIIKPEDNRVILNLLAHQDERIRFDAWKNVTNIMDKDIIKVENIKNYLEGFISLLRSEDKKINIDSWILAITIIEKNIIEPELTRGSIEYLFSFLNSDNENFSQKLWKKVPEFIQKKIITQEDSIMFISFLNSKNTNISINTWDLIDFLISKKILNIEDAKDGKSTFFNFLKSENEDYLSKAWNRVPYLIQKDIIIPEDSEVFLNLLIEPEETIRNNAWYMMIRELVDLGIITPANSTKFIPILSSENYNIRKDAWHNIPYLITKGIIKDGEVIEKKRYFLEFFSSKDENIRKSAFSVASELIKRGIISSGDSDIFLNFLASPDERTSSDSWRLVPELLEKGVIKDSEVIEKKRHFLEFFSSKDENIRKSAFSVASELIKRGIISSGDSDIFLNLLASPDDRARENAWRIVIELINNGIIKSSKTGIFMDLLSNKNEKVRFGAWHNVIYLIDKGLLKDELVKFKIEDFKKFSMSKDITISSNIKSESIALLKKGLLSEKDEIEILNRLYI